MTTRARIELYMKTGPIGLSTRGAIVRARDGSTVTSNVMTRLTGGTVVELDVDDDYTYEFNVVGEGRFSLAVRPDGSTIQDLERAEFDGAGAIAGPHRGRSFTFKVQP